MTVFITACWKKSLSRVICAGLWLFYVGLVCAGGIESKSVSLVPDDSGQALSAEFAIDLGPRFAEAVERGMVLHFRFEFMLSRKRWYVYEEHVTGRILDYKLGYQALTRQYRLTQGAQQQHFDSLEEALMALARIQRLHVIDKGVLVPGEAYKAAVRLSLDRSQLPKPLQVDALTDREWRVEAKTHFLEFVAAADK